MIFVLCYEWMLMFLSGVVFFELLEFSLENDGVYLDNYVVEWGLVFEFILYWIYIMVVKNRLLRVDFLENLFW